MLPGEGQLTTHRIKVTNIKTFLVGGSWRNWLIVKLDTDMKVVDGWLEFPL